MREVALWNNPVDGMGLTEMRNVGGFPERHFLFNVIEELEKSTYSALAIWGTYANANSLRKFLKMKYGIVSDACIVNREYINISVNNVTAEDDFPLCCLEDFIKKYHSLDIIVDFSFYQRGMLAEYEAHINRIFVGDIMGSFIFHKPYVINRKIFDHHLIDFMSTIDMLDDDISKNEFATFIQQKIFGFYNKKHHDKQYFDTDLIQLSSNETFVDVGAYNGDTVFEFISMVNTYRYIYSIEMDSSNYRELVESCKDVPRLKCINKGVGEKRVIKHAVIGNKSASFISENSTHSMDEIEMDSLDNMIADEVTFIKMDIEGYELAALKGARRLITNFKPTLAICLYHKVEDLWEIPMFIKSIVPEYRLYFRNYHNSASECVLYAL